MTTFVPMSKKRNNYLVLEDDPIDFEIIGICSQLPEYKFIWSINDCLKSKFVQKEESLITYDKKGIKKAEFSTYFYTHPVDRVNFYLIKNKNEGDVLISEKMAIDYFLFIYDNISFDLSDLVTQLKKVDSVLGAYVFEQDEIPSAENLTLQ